MKLFRTTLLLAASLMAATLFPSCGGSAENSGNQFVSVSAFKSGSCGFYIVGSPVVRIRSNGTPNEVSPGPNSSAIIEHPDSSMVSGSDVDPGWEDFAGGLSDITQATSSCLVDVTISHSSSNEYAISGVATYAVNGDLGYMELGFNEVSGSGNNLEYSSLIHFMGALQNSDLTYTSDGSSIDTSGTSSGTAERILITSLTGSVIRFWFNFETNQVLTELNYIAEVKTDVVRDKDGNVIGFQTTGARMTGVWRITHSFYRLNN